MNRPLLFSAVVALSAHGALFLFRQDVIARPAVIAPPAEKKEVIQVAPLDPEPPEETLSDAPPKSSDQALPGIPDAPSPHASDSGITMPVTPFRPVIAGNFDRIDPSALNGAPGPGGPGLRMGTPFGIGDLDNPPRTRAQVSPVYPMEARREGRRGEVTIEFTVDEQGRVLNPQVKNSTGREFEDPALRAVQKWRFEPGRRDGRVVRFKMSVPVVFSISTD